MNNDTEERTKTHACDCISRQTAITAIQKAYVDTEGGTDKCAVWKNVGLTNALHIMQDLPSAQPEIVNQTEKSAQNVPNSELILKKAAIDALEKMSVNYGKAGRRERHPHIEECKAEIRMLPSAQPDVPDTNVGDMISRQAAIDALGDKPLAWTEGEYELGLQNQWQSDVDALKALPSAQPEQRWIPCSERLPEIDELVLVTDDSGGVKTVGADRCGQYECSEERFWYYTQNVIAWMSLPEAYGGEQG